MGGYILMVLLFLVILDMGAYTAAVIESDRRRAHYSWWYAAVPGGGFALLYREASRL